MGNSNELDKIDKYVKQLNSGQIKIEDKPVTKKVKKAKSNENKSFEKALYNIVLSQDQGSLGYGYDTSGDVADSSCLTESLFNYQFEQGAVNFLGANNKKFAAKVVPDRDYKMHSYFGSNAEELAEDISSKIGIDASYGMFGGAFESNFENKHTNKQSKTYLSVISEVRIMRLLLPDNFKECIKPEVQSKLDSTIAPKEIFDAYGTHFLYEVCIGGYARYNLTTNTNEIAKITSISNSFSLTAKPNVPTEGNEGAVGGGGRASYTNTKDTKNIHKDEITSKSIKFKGGNAHFQDETKIGEWIKSVYDAPTLSGFTKKSLKPIWDLCKEEGRRKELSDAFPQYMESKMKAKVEKPRLEIKKINQLSRIFYDDGTGCVGHLAVYAPNNDKSAGYYVLGHVAVDRYQHPDTTYVVKDLSGDALKSPLGCEKVWEDKGSGSNDDFSFWKIIAPDDYVAMGYLASKGYNQPDLSNVKCVHKDLVADGKLGLIWMNIASEAMQFMSSVPLSFEGAFRMFEKIKGVLNGGDDINKLVFKGNSRVAVYTILPDDEKGVDGTNLFYVENSYDTPQPQPPVKVIKINPASVIKNDS
jgi:hypothetical protein